MSKKKPTKLSLNRETVLHLDQLARARGAGTEPVGFLSIIGKKCGGGGGGGGGTTVLPPCHTQSPGLCPTQPEDTCPSQTIDP